MFGAGRGGGREKAEFPAIGRLFMLILDIEFAIEFNVGAPVDGVAQGLDAWVEGIPQFSEDC